METNSKKSSHKNNFIDVCYDNKSISCEKQDKNTRLLLDRKQKSSQIQNQKYFCDICDYTTSKQSNYDKHQFTAKHKWKQSATFCSSENTEKYNCSFCGKKYKTRSGIWKHEKTCAKNIDTPSAIPSEVVMKLIEKNNELQQLIIEQNRESTANTQKLQEQMLNIVSENRIINNTTNTTNNTQNNNFNLNFFLNEQCKNAMDISDFLKTVQVDLEDVANVGKLGYVEGISRIFMKALNNIDIYERPIHCSDLKREVMYIKDNGIWEKDSEDKSSMKKAVQLISHRNVMKIKAWTDANPSWKTHYSKEEDEYLKISYESMGGSNAEEDEKYFNKIIRKVANNVVINKDLQKKS